MRVLYVVVGLILFFFNPLSAQTITSATSGPWDQTTTWVGGVVPTSSNSTLVQIASTHAVSIPAGYNATAVSVTLAPVGATTCSLTIASTGSLSFTGTLTLGSGVPTRGKVTVNGTLIVENGATIGPAASLTRLTVAGTYRHNYTTTAGQIYKVTWSPGSTLEIAGYTDFSPAAFTPPLGLNQTFPNFKWNCTNQAMDMYLGAAAGSTLSSVTNNFTVAATNGFAFGLATNTDVTLTIGGSLTIGTNSYFDITGGPNGTGNGIVNLAGDFILSGDDGLGNFGAGTAALNFNGSSTSPQAFNSPYSISTAVDFTVVNGATLNIAETSSIQTAGGFTLQAGATLGVASPDGLVTGQTNGNIRTFGSRTYTAGGNIIYNGTVAQNLGSEWGSTGALNGFAVNLEIANTSTGGVTNDIVGSTSLVGRLRLSKGALNIGNANTLVISGDFEGADPGSVGPPVVPARTGTISGHSSGTSNLTFNGSGTISGTLNFTSGANSLKNFVIDRAGDITLGSNLTITSTGTLTFSSTANLQVNGQTLTINGNMAQTGSGAIASTLTSTSNLVIGGSGALAVLPLCTSCSSDNEFNNVTLSRTGASSAYNWATPANIHGILDLTSGAFTHSSGLTMIAGSTFRRSAGTTYSGSTPNAATTYNVSYIGTVTTSNELPTTAQNRLMNLTIAGNTTLDKNININGDLSITGGTLLAGAHDITMLGQTFAINGGSFSIGSSNFVTFSRPSGTTTMSGSTIDGAQFGNLTIASGTTLVAPSANINISGQWDNNGTFTANGGTVTFNGGAQNIDAAGQSFFNLATSGGTKTLVSNLDVNGQLTINSASTLFADTYNINVAGVWSNSGTYSYTNLSTATVTFDGTTQSINSNGQNFNNVTFANSGTKTQTAALNVRGDLTINSGVTLDVSSSNFNLNVGHNFTNNGTFNPRSGTVFFDGSLVQTIGGTTNTVFNNITTSNATTVTFSSNQSLSNVLTLNSGVFSPNNHFTMLSTAVRDARIAPLGGTASIDTTRMTIQRYLPNANSTQNTRYLTPSISNATVAGWQDDFPITGSFTGASTNATWPASNPSLYRYKESQAGNPAFNSRWDKYPTTNFRATLTRGVGYAAYVMQTTPITIEQVGIANWGAVSVAVTNQSGASNDGWNLIGNPYAAPINWENVTIPAGVYQEMTVLDNMNNVGAGAGRYIYYLQGSPGLAVPSSYDGTIASGQAFFIWKSAVGSTNLTFQEDDKMAVSHPTFIRESLLNVLRINVTGNDHEDELVIHFDDNAQDIADGLSEAHKMTNDYITFSSLTSDGVEMAINTFGSLTCSKQVDLHLTNVTPGTHTFTFSQFESFDQNVKLRLLDNFTGQSFDVTTESTVYNFDVTTDSASFGENRFKMFIGYSGLNTGLKVEASSICVGSDASVKVYAPEAGVIYYATINGTTISDPVAGKAGQDLVLSIPGSKLASSNSIVIMARLDQCTVPLSNHASIDAKTLPTISATNDAANCGAGSVILGASGAPADGSYHWYLTEDATVAIDGANSSAYTTPTLTKTKTYFVSAVNSLGCEGGRMAVTATINYVDAPTISISGNVLTSSASTGNQWYLDGTPIDGATGQTYEASKSGVYRLVVTSGACSNAVEQEFAVTGDLEEGIKGYSVYPNATRGLINIEVGTLDPVSVTITNQIGVEITRGELRQEGMARKGQLDISGNAAGIYLVVIRHGENTVVKKILKN